ncbi:dihydrofolate reductase [Formosa agariphila KMM 3901]|uniref:Dihydrofolate reductase n=1 Tax=Formosa agariphila (strain DSM 15362 / KCTC 12365 / LMG 23005 / KMM 3901 / M-2Alg 35-1) TaxID=1347342 RepID=T2KPK7_FORAG|nr:dihydrofolate reductase family protein [Formosa agariphila]CDF80381.1 dihydrofolate reductase [Formosa agariphila KMM 3901]
MKKVKLYIAMSLNGKIAAADGGVDWLEAIPNPDDSDYGYSNFYDSIDTTVQGHATYKEILSWDIEFPYLSKRNYVFTRDETKRDDRNAMFVSKNPVDFMRDLKLKDGKDIWLIGGGQINTLLLNAGLIDEIQVYVMPIILTEGINLFEALPNETGLHLESSKTYASGAVEMLYTIK